MWNKETKNIQRNSPLTNLIVQPSLEIKSSSTTNFYLMTLIWSLYSPNLSLPAPQSERGGGKRDPGNEVDVPAGEALTHKELHYLLNNLFRSQWFFNLS